MHLRTWRPVLCDRLPQSLGNVPCEPAGITCDGNSQKFGGERTVNIPSIAFNGQARMERIDGDQRRMVDLRAESGSPFILCPAENESDVLRDPLPNDF